MKVLPAASFAKESIELTGWLRAEENSRSKVNSA
jgi:hypothetical protein